MSSSAPVARSVSVPDLSSPDRIAHRQVSKVFSLVRTLSGASLRHGASPAPGHCSSPTWQDGPRMPLFPLPPPIVAAASPSSFGGADSDGDCDELFLHSLSSCSRAPGGGGLKRLRSFGSSRPSLLGPSRASPGLSGGFRPPPIHTAASLDPGLGGSSGSFSDAIISSPVLSHAPPRPIHTTTTYTATTIAGSADAAAPDAAAAASAAISTPVRSSSRCTFFTSSDNPKVLIPPSPAESAFASVARHYYYYSAASLPPPTPAAGRATPISAATTATAAATSSTATTATTAISSATAVGGGRSHSRRVCARLSRSSVAPMSLVAPNLFVGDESAAADLRALRAAGVTHILNCTPVPSVLEGTHVALAPCQGAAAGTVAVEGPGASPPPLRFCQLGLLDSISDLPRMQGALRTGVAFIAEAIRNGGTVLVHCHRGISRSATLAIAYLMSTTHQTAETVFEHMRTRRRVIDPNLTYWTQLIEWERQVLPPRVLAKQGGSSSTTPSRASAAGVGCGGGGLATPSGRSSASMPPSPSVVRPLSRVG